MLITIFLSILNVKSSVVFLYYLLNFLRWNEIFCIRWSFSTSSCNSCFSVKYYFVRHLSYPSEYCVICICFKYLSIMWNVKHFLCCVILINFHLGHSSRWPKRRTSQGICQGSWAYCLTELWSCSEHVGIWTIREIIRGKPLKIENYKINCSWGHLSFRRNDWQWCFLCSTSSCKLL